MEFKRFLINKLILFFMLSTLITVAVALLGTAFDSQARLGYDSLLAPVKYAGLCLLPTLVTWSRHELSVKQLLLRKVLMLVLLETVILLIGYTSPVIDTDRLEVVLALAGSVLLIFVLANLFQWLRASAEAKELNRELARFQNQHG